MSYTDVGICNSALIKLGVDTIVSLSDDSRAAKLCNEQYDKIKKKHLRSHPWNFAVTRVSLSATPNAPAFDFTKEFNLPNDCLRVLKVNDGTEQWTKEGNKLLAYDSPADVIYIKDADESLFDANFAESLALALAVDLSHDLSPTKTQLLLAEYEQTLREARSFDAQENFPTLIRTTTFTRARR